MATAPTPSPWLTTYLSALTIRDAHEQALRPTYDAYTKLADRAGPPSTPPVAPSAPSSPRPSTPRPSSSQKAPTATTTTTTTTTPSPDALTRLRHDLSLAQTSKTALTTQLSTLSTTLTTTRAALATSTAQVTSLTATTTSLSRKLRDREEELVEKARLVERVQDELLAAEVEVNVAVEGRRRCEEENRELVGRLLGFREREVEVMNREGGWG